jgi:hypothetical protein
MQMAFSSIGNLPLGKFLQIAFSEGLRNQLSSDYRDWDMIKQKRVGNAEGREIRFLFKTGNGPARVQSRNPNFTVNFPKSSKLSASEHIAVAKEIDATIELDYNLWKRLSLSGDVKYVDSLAAEIEATQLVTKRYMAASLYKDGSGVVAQVASVADNTTLDQIVVTLSSSDSARGHVGFAEYDDLLLPYELNGTARAPTVTGTFYAFKIVDRDRDANTITIKPVDASESFLQLTASNLVATDVFYRVGQPSIPDLTAAVSDWGTLSEEMAGLESLLANDGRIVHGITMSGATGATTKDAGGVQLDVTHIEAVMNNAKIRVGESAYSWKKMCMSPEAHSSFIESRETDRRFQSIEDNKRGLRMFAYQHRNDLLEVYASEYVPSKRVYILPEEKSGAGKVLEYHGSDFETVKAPNGDEFRMKVGANGYERRIESNLEAYGVLICKHPAACAVIKNFSI